MKIRFLQSFLTLAFVLGMGVLAFAQPANDDCPSATEITLAADEGSCVLVEGSTVGGTPSVAPDFVCSGSWFSDDIWFKFSTGADVPSGGVVVKAYFGDSNMDVPAIGMAIYAGCGSAELPFGCFSSADPEDDQIHVFAGNLQPNFTYYIRIWSGGSPTDDSGTVRVCAYEAEPDNANVLMNWGFDGDIGDWETSDLSADTALWTFTTTGSQGAFGNYVISSPTSSNGYMMFDADFYQTGGDPDNLPAGPPYPQYEAELVSPIIDCTSCPPTSVRFWQFYRALNGDTYLYWSVDGGNTWIGPINVNEELEPNTSTSVPSEKRFFIPDLAGQDSARIRFVFDGDFYAWLVDDVQIIETERNNLRVMENWWAIPTNKETPSDQVEDFGFIADIYNAGSAVQPNTMLNVTVTETSGTVPTWSRDLDYGDIGADSLDENRIFPDLFAPQAGLATDYTITYTVSSDSVDFDPSDNSLSHVYTVTDTVFSKETGRTRSLRPADALWADGAPHSWSIGNYFYVVNGDENFNTSATIGITNPQDHAGKILLFVLYKFTDSNGDQLVQPSEREQVGANTYEITGNEMANAVLNIPMFDLNPSDPLNPGPVPLDDNSEYILMVQYTTDQDDDNIFFEASEAYDFSAGVWLTEQLANPRYSHVLHIGGEEDFRLVPTADLSTTNFGHDIVPLLRMNVNKMETNVEQLPADNSVKVYPNPASELLTVDIELVNASENVELKLIDLTGKVVDMRQYDQLQKANASFDVSQLPAGGYFLHINTEEGQRSQYFVVQR